MKERFIDLIEGLSNDDILDILTSARFRCSNPDLEEQLAAIIRADKEEEKINTDHLFLNSNTSSLECTMCDKNFPIPFPVSMNMMHVVTLQFRKEHTYCKKSAT